MYGFVVDFIDWDILQVYQDYLDYKVLGGKLVVNVIGGIDGILVFDFFID